MYLLTLSKNGIWRGDLVHDYNNNKLFGVKKAIEKHEENAKEITRRAIKGN